MASLKAAFQNVDAMYDIPEDDVVSEVFVPAMKIATNVRIGAGFFSSKCLAQLAPGLALLINDSDRKIEILASPALSVEDINAIKLAHSDPELVIQNSLTKLFRDASLSEQAIVKHSIECLAYLVATNRLELRIVLMPVGQYHKKFWLFSLGEDTVAVHGSGNATERGMLVNGEQMSVDVSWTGDKSSIRKIEKLSHGWEAQWSDNSRYSRTFAAGKALDFLKSLKPGKVPTIEEFWQSWRKDFESGFVSRPEIVVLDTTAKKLIIPDWLNWEHGNYRHQSLAVQAFESNNRNGLLAIATGGGKTKTSLVAATRSQNIDERALIVCIVVPSTPLELQWCEEVREFGLEPIRLSQYGASERHILLSDLLATYSSGSRDTTVFVLTRHLFVRDAKIAAFFERAAKFLHAMFIGDEVHNLGAKSFIESAPDYFDFRLGLSATPVRQYDPDGTDRLLDFFGGQVFEFSLEQAIKSGCLVPYNYFLIEVLLDDDEFERYVDLTQQIVRAGAQADDDGRAGIDDSLVSRLLMKRRAILEYARDKRRALRVLLTELTNKGINKTLIYASAKESPPEEERQIDVVNEMLNELQIPFHQITSEETASGSASNHLDRFGAGKLKVLTAMKVLDEGVDIPQTDTAILLASSAVEREWVQRRGRVLRSAPGKASASIYDFLVVPPEIGNAYSKSIMKSELARIEAFAVNSSNEWSGDGARMVLEKYERH